MNEINEMIIRHNLPDDPGTGAASGGGKVSGEKAEPKENSSKDHKRSGKILQMC